MAVSSIPTLKANLKSALDTLAATNGNALQGVQIAYGAPLPNPEREYVWIDNVDGDQQWAAIGHLRKEEEYVVEVLFHSTFEGTDQQTATERVFAMAAALETQLRTDPTVSGAVRVAGFGGRIQLVELCSNDGTRRGCHLTIGVRCQQRI